MSFFKHLKKPKLIAEISANHNGSLQHAKKLIECAKKNGADFVKFQTYEPQHMTLKSNRKEFLIKKGLWKGQTLWKLYSKAQTPLSWQKPLFQHAKKIGIKAFSSPFDTECVEYLEKINCPIYKIASFEMNDYSLLKSVCKTGKPIIISTGLASMKEIIKTVKFAKKNGAKDLALLYCVTSYPASIKDFNLKNINILKKKFKLPVGFSDHSNSNIIAQLAVSMGATLFEKHIALENQKKGFDIKFSLRGREIKKFKNDLLNAYFLTCNENFHRTANEKKLLIHRRSIYSTKDIKKGEIFSEKNTKSVRPGYGLKPELYFELIGRKAKKNILKHTPIKKKHYK